MADPHRTQPIEAQTDQLPALPAVKSLGRLGRYELLTLLAKGGMGEVYLARVYGLAGFEKLVVIKRNLPSLAAEHEPLFAEARLVATLQHTNIVQVLDVETDGATVFIAMEFLHGQDVRAIVRRSWGAGTALPLDQAIAVVLAVCAGLHYAHEKREGDGTPLEIVHRDVSPSNVFVTYDGGVKLIDFGIAKATTLPSETQLGTIKGKPGYMSPEQCRGEPLDRRSDLFSVGILLYELTCGRRPFYGESEYLLYRELCERDPPLPSTLRPGYPPALEAIVMSALAKDRRDRPANAHDLQEQLAQLASELRLEVSQFGLGRYMARTFEDELSAWRDAQRTGQSLVEHVLRRATASVPIIDASIAMPHEVSMPSARTTAMELKSPLPRRRRRFALAMLAAGLVAVIAAIVIAVAVRDDVARSAPAATRPATSLPPAVQPAIEPPATPPVEPPATPPVEPAEPAMVSNPPTTASPEPRPPPVKKRPVPKRPPPGPDDPL